MWVERWREMSEYEKGMIAGMIIGVMLVVVIAILAAFILF